MKFPDYSHSVEIQQLLTAMGVSKIPAVPAVRFEKIVIKKVERVHLDLEDIEISERLIDSAIPVDKTEIVSRSGALLEYKGRKVCAYIRDQKVTVNFYNRTSRYKYHLTNCETLQYMKSYGREHRYLVTQRSDGLFEAHDLTTQPIETGKVKMKLCYNCMTQLRIKGLYFSPFSLKEYYKKYDSYTPKSIRKIEEVRETQTYAPDQKQISDKYRNACKFVCQVCSLDCTESTGLLHLHHVDGNPANNKRKNLNVLCVDCHSRQPLHGHMLGNPKVKRQLDIIVGLRRDQGLLTVDTHPKQAPQQQFAVNQFRAR